MEFSYVIVHYDEIGLKGSNKRYFEKLLCSHIKNKLDKFKERITTELSQINILLSEEGINNIDKVTDILKRIPGIANFSFAVQSSLELVAIQKVTMDLAKSMEFDSFRISTKRHNKNFPMTSQEIDREVGAVIFTDLEKKVKLRNPEIEFKVEIASQFAYISAKKIPGVGGLPVNHKQKMVALLSGGIDSPVAAYLLMKRGCEVIFVHFQNENQMTDSVEDKIVRLAKQLSKYQMRTKLFIVPFKDIQKELIMKVHSTMRMLVYRKIMIDIAARYAGKEKAKFLIVGDSLSQVASQTIENLDAVYDKSPKKILSPLIGLDKKEITKISQEIGTYEISILPYGDCCSYFLPKHPMLRATPYSIEKALAPIDMEPLINDAIENAKLFEYK